LLLDRHKEQMQYVELLNGILAATICNFSMGAPKQPATPSDFMPSAPAKEKKQRVNRKALATKMRCFLMAQVQERKEN
jgi:hypothetical protein